MRFTDGWKYRLEEGMAYKLQYDYALEHDAVTPWFTITKTNWLLVQPGYASDGATLFPDFDWIKTPAIAIHDPLCQAIEMGIIPESMNDQIDLEIEAAINAQPGSWLKRQAMKARARLVRRGTNFADSKAGKSRPINELPRLKHEISLAEYKSLVES